MLGFAPFFAFFQTHFPENLHALVHPHVITSAHMSGMTSVWEQVSQCPLIFPLSLVVEEMECYMLPVSTPLTVMCNCRALLVGGNDSCKLHLPNITTRALSQQKYCTSCS